MPDWTVLGMPLRPEEDMAQPLEAAVIVKGLDSDGKIAYWATCTEGLTGVEILGMCSWGAAVALRAESDA